MAQLINTIQVLRTSRRAIRILVPRDEVAGLVRNMLPNALCDADVGGTPVLSPNSAPNWGSFLTIWGVDRDNSDA